MFDFNHHINSGTKFMTMLDHNVQTSHSWSYKNKHN